MAKSKAICHVKCAVAVCAIFRRVGPPPIVIVGFVCEQGLEVDLPDRCAKSCVMAQALQMNGKLSKEVAPVRLKLTCLRTISLSWRL